MQLPERGGTPGALLLFRLFYALWKRPDVWTINKGLTVL